jgi:thiol:disulfide interchange protein
MKEELSSTRIAYPQVLMNTTSLVAGKSHAVTTASRSAQSAQVAATTPAHVQDLVHVLAQVTAAHRPHHPTEVDENAHESHRRPLSAIASQARRRAIKIPAKRKTSTQAITKIPKMHKRIDIRRAAAAVAAKRTKRKVEATKISRNTISSMMTSTLKLSKKENRIIDLSSFAETSSNHKLSILYSPPALKFLLRNQLKLK